MRISSQGKVVRCINISGPAQRVLREQAAGGEELIHGTRGKVGGVRQIFGKKKLHIARGGGRTQGKRDAIDTFSLNLKAALCGDGDEGVP
jgi:hypothetical protein